MPGAGRPSPILRRVPTHAPVRAAGRWRRRLTGALAANPPFGAAEYIGVFQRVIAPAARAFRPDYWIVSCGFDAHEDDPLAAMRVTRSGYAALTAIVRALADQLSQGRMLFVLEGGYSLRGLREGADALLAGLLAEAPAPPRAGDLVPGSALEALVARAVAVHGPRIPDLGAPGV